MRGTCHALFAHDVGFALDLERVARLLGETAQRAGFRHRPPSPGWFECRPKPLRVSRSGDPLSLAGFSTTGTVELALYDFGAVSVAHALPFDAPLERLTELSVALYENPDLAAASRRRVEELLAAIRPAVEKPSLCDLVEDYAIWEIPGLSAADREGRSLEEWLAANASAVARLLRCEKGPLAPEEIRDALAVRVSYAPEDAVLVDWNAALVLLDEPGDVRTVLEFANVELLEMRHLDDELDVALDRAQEALSRRSLRARLLGRSAEELARVGRMQVDNALLFEGVNSALKLVGDQYLARVYRRAAERFHLPAWDESILRKLSAVDGIHQKMADESAASRMEILEWIIIVLFVVSILVALPWCR